jgi:hypothetical protein
MTSDVIDAPGECGGEVCDHVPVSTCIDDDTLRTYASTCTADRCEYPSTDVDCGDLGCCGDHCCLVKPSNEINFGSLGPSSRAIDLADATFDLR